MKYNLMSKDNLIVPILEEEVQNSVSGESEAWGAGCAEACAAYQREICTVYIILDTSITIP